MTCSLAADEQADLGGWLTANASAVMSGLDGGLEGACAERAE